MHAPVAREDRYRSSAPGVIPTSDEGAE